MYKRFELRRSIGIPMEIITSLWDEPIDLVASDLSPRGAYIETELMPEYGEHLVCSFTLPGLEECCFFGEVSRVNLFRRKRESGRPGFGVNFLDPSPMQRLRIRHSLRGLPPPVPSPQRQYEQRAVEANPKTNEMIHPVGPIVTLNPLVSPVHLGRFRSLENTRANSARVARAALANSTILPRKSPPVVCRPIIRV